MSYSREVYSLRERIGAVEDERTNAVIPASEVAAAMLFCGLLRVRSLNALEPRLSEKPFRLLLGAPLNAERMGSADTVSRSLRTMDLESVREVSVGIVKKAERNKVFREGWHGALRYVAVDGWEPISSWRQHCDSCLVRNVKVKKRDDEVATREQYYHRYAVAMLIDERFDLALDIEPLLTADMRPGKAGRRGENEGELTAATRLLRRVKQTYGWLDVVVGDALYANGPFLTVVKELGMGAVVVAKKESDEPLKEALAIWRHQPPTEVVVNAERHERIELWDCPDIETLGSYDGTIRVVRGRVTRTDKPKEPAHTWCMAVTGKAARLPPVKVLAVARGRWHIENTGFHQWVTRWHFAHVFVHDGRGITSLYWLFFAAFNLLTLFMYRQLRCYARDRGKHVTRTISRLIDEMLDELARLRSSPWNSS